MVNKLAHDIRIAADRKLAAITYGHTKTAEVFFRSPDKDLTEYEQSAERANDIMGAIMGSAGAALGGSAGGALGLGLGGIPIGALGALGGALTGGYIGKHMGRGVHDIFANYIPDQIMDTPEHPTFRDRTIGRAAMGAAIGAGRGIANSDRPKDMLIDALLGAVTGGISAPITNGILDGAGKLSIDMID